MYFKDIPGQDDLKGLLRQLQMQDRIPHALMFSGSAGRGTLPLVRAFTALLFCENPQEGESCGTCKYCIKTHQLNHPDVHYTVPIAGSKNTSNQVMKDWKNLMKETPYASLQDWQVAQEEENKQLNINVKELNDIVEFASLKAYEGKAKVLVIWMAEFLEKEGNRLLKLIEEPPEGMYIFLITENLDRVLNTIRSRCQSFLVKPIDESTIKNWLIENNGISDEAADKIAFLSNGSVGKALKILEKNDNTDMQNVLAWLRICYKGFPHEITAFADQMAKSSKEHQKHFLDLSLNALESILMAKHLGIEAVRIPESLQKPVLSLANLLNLYQKQMIIDAINTALESLGNYVNTKLVYTQLSIQLHHAFHTKKEYTV